MPYNSVRRHKTHSLFGVGCCGLSSVTQVGLLKIRYRSYKPIFLPAPTAWLAVQGFSLDIHQGVVVSGVHARMHRRTHTHTTVSIMTITMCVWGKKSPERRAKGVCPCRYMPYWEPCRFYRVVPKRPQTSWRPLL